MAPTARLVEQRPPLDPAQIVRASKGAALPPYLPTMNQPANITNDAKPPKPRRISKKVRTALEARVYECLTWDQAAKRAGMSPAGIHKARKQQHVQDLHEHLIAQQIKEMEDLKRPLKALAYQEARRLMKEAKSETVRARMVEFLAGERDKSPQVAVNIQNNVGAGGYEYAPPGSRIVDIEVSEDTASPTDDSETPTK